MRHIGLTKPDEIEASSPGPRGDTPAEQSQTAGQNTAADDALMGFSLWVGSLCRIMKAAAAATVADAFRWKVALVNASISSIEPVV